MRSRLNRTSTVAGLPRASCSEIADQCTLVARARYPIECNVEYQKVIFQGQFRDCPKMPLRIGGTHRKVRLGLQSKYAGTQQLTCTKKHVLLESLNVDFDKISLGDHPFGQQAIQSPHWHHPNLLHR